MSLAQSVRVCMQWKGVGWEYVYSKLKEECPVTENTYVGIKTLDQEYILTELGCQEKTHGKSLLLEQILHTWMSTFTQFVFIAIMAKCLNKKFIHWFEYKSKLGGKTSA